MHFFSVLKFFGFGTEGGELALFFPHIFFDFSNDNPGKIKVKKKTGLNSCT